MLKIVAGLWTNLWQRRAHSNLRGSEGVLILQLLLDLVIVFIFRVLSLHTCIIGEKILVPITPPNFHCPPSYSNHRIRVGIVNVTETMSLNTANGQALHISDYPWHLSSHFTLATTVGIPEEIPLISFWDFGPGATKIIIKAINSQSYGAPSH